jgi:hypothetical protein
LSSAHILTVICPREAPQRFTWMALASSLSVAVARRADFQY